MNIRIAAVLLLAFLAGDAAAADRLAGLAEMIANGNASGARAPLLAAQRAFQAENDARGEARALLLLAFANVTLGDSLAASASLEECATKLVDAGDPFGAWTARILSAGVELERGNGEKALQQLELASEMSRLAAGAPPSFDSIAELAPIFGFPSAMFELLKQMPLPSFAVRVLLQGFEAVTQLVLADALVVTSNLERADKALDRAAELSTMLFGALDAEIAERRGHLARRRWQFAEARKYYQQALADNDLVPLTKTWDEWRDVTLMNHLAEIEILDGRPDAALSWNDKALRFVRDRKQRTREAVLLQNRAELLAHDGRITEAFGVLEHAEGIAESRWENALQASILTDIGSLQMYSGDYGAAATTLEKAIGFHASGNDVRGEARTWAMLAELYLLLSAVDHADTAMERACALATQSGFAAALRLVDLFPAMRLMMTASTEKDILHSLERALAVPEIITTPPGALPGRAQARLLFRARDRIRSGDLAGGRVAFEELLQSALSDDVRAAAMTGIGAIDRKEGRFVDALRWLREAADRVEAPLPAIRDDVLLSAYLGAERRWSFDLLIDTLVQLGMFEEAFEATERARARAFLRTIGNHRIAARGAGAELVREVDALRRRIAEWEANGAPLRSDLENARKRYSTLMTRIKTASPEYASLTNVEPLRADEIRAEIPPDTTLISYFIAGSGGHAFLVDRQNVRHVALPLDSAALRRALCWAREFQPERSRGTRPRATHCADAASSSEIYDMLVAPLRSAIQTARLILVPHGSLHYIPFAALHDAQRDRYLIDDYTLTFSPSASALRFLREKETPVAGCALVLGDPVTRMGALSGARTEAVTVANELGTAPLLGNDAKESVLFRLGGTVDLVHIGAHGQYDSANPLFSGIALSEGDDRDGFLEVHEIVGELDLTGVNLVVLSACETAMGDRSGGDDVVGLTRAILYAGSPAVVSTLWKIDDLAAEALMNEFYRRFVSGSPVADALRGAQLALRTTQYADPKYWAAFLLIGEPSGRWSH